MFKFPGGVYHGIEFEHVSWEALRRLLAWFTSSRLGFCRVSGLRFAFEGRSCERDQGCEAEGQSRA